MRLNTFAPAALLLALSACGGSGGAGTVVTPSEPAPMPAPTSPPPRALECTAKDAVRRADALQVTPLAGTVRIVAFGSSSTYGTGATGPAATYPAVLQGLLAARADLARFEVLNKGVPGDVLQQLEARLDRDVLAEKPQLVLLQTGTNDARDFPGDQAVRDFTERLRQMVRKLKAQAPVVLINSQWYPSQPANTAAFLTAMETVAAEENVALFDRYELVKSQVASGKYTIAQVFYQDQVHQSDLTYRCMAEVIADLVAARTIK